MGVSLGGSGVGVGVWSDGSEVWGSELEVGVSLGGSEL